MDDRAKCQDMRDGCLEIIGLVETVFEPAAMVIFEQQATVRRLEEFMSGLARTVGPEGQKQLEAAVTDATAHLHSIKGQFEFLETVAAKLRSSALKIRSLTDEQKRNIVTSNMVATNARVVSSSIADGQAALQGFAVDVKGIITAAGIEAARVAEKLSHAEAGLNDVSHGVEEMTGTARRLGDQRVRLPVILEGLRAFPDIMAGVSVTQRACRKLDSSLQSAVIHLQCGDSVRQRLEHVVGILDRQANCGPEASVVLLTLAQVQMDAALEALEDALESATPHLEEIEKQAARVIDATVSLSRMPETSLLRDVARIAGDMNAGLIRLDSIRESLEPAMERLAQSYADAAAATEAISDLQTRMHLLGINATLASNKLGSGGEAMIQVSLQLRECTTGIGTLSTEIIHAAQLQELNAILFVAPTARASSPEHEKQLGGIEKNCAALIAELVELDTGRHQDEIGKMVAAMLRLAGLRKRLGTVRPGAVHGSMKASSGFESILSDLRSQYTMQSERDLHDKLLGLKNKDAEGVQMVENDEELDDLFF